VCWASHLDGCEVLVFFIRVRMTQVLVLVFLSVLYYGFSE
jgi:hypothetical protein